MKIVIFIVLIMVVIIVVVNVWLNGIFVLDNIFGLMIRIYVNVKKVVMLVKNFCFIEVLYFCNWNMFMYFFYIWIIIIYFFFY